METGRVSRNSGVRAQCRSSSSQAKPTHAQALFLQFKAECYSGGYSQLTAFIREWRAREDKAPPELSGHKVSCGLFMSAQPCRFSSPWPDLFHITVGEAVLQRMADQARERLG